MVDAATLCVAGEGLDINLCCGTLPGRRCTWKYSPSFLRGRRGAGEKIKCAHTVFHFPFRTHSVLIHLLCRFSFPSLLPNLVLLFGRNHFVTHVSHTISVTQHLLHTKFLRHYITYNFLCYTHHRLHTTFSLTMLYTSSLSQMIFHSLSL